MKLSCAALAAPALVVVLTSSVVLHGTVLVAVAVGTGLTAVLACALGDEGRAASLEAGWMAAGGVFLVSIATAALFVVAGGGVAAVFVLVVAAAVGAGLLRWCLRVRLPDRKDSLAEPDDDQVAEDLPCEREHLHRFSVPVSLLPMPALDREWHRTGAALAVAQGPAQRCAVVRRRQEVLDELERRDPAGFAGRLAALLG